jgi:hypothetical protein
MSEPIVMKLGMYVTVLEPILTVYFINPSHQSVCLHVYPLVVARQLLGMYVPKATNKRKEELLGSSFSMKSVP